MSADASNVRTASVRGKCLADGFIGPFSGNIKLERRPDGIYYTWHLESPNGEFLGERSQFVSDKVLPHQADPFAFALEHAIEGLRRYRINRRRAYEVAEWAWVT
jgi:hypothetical protein